MPIHVAIMRKVRPGCEAEFQEELRKFFQASFNHPAVMGVSMIVPPLGSTSRESGILRTFRNEHERDEFYASPLFREWDTRARELTEGEPVYRQLHGLEAWFRSPHFPPPRWKMAIVTFIGVYPISLLIGLFLSPRLQNFPLWQNLFIVSAIIVACLTWIIMPLLTRIFKTWLNPPPNKGNSYAQSSIC